MTKLKLWQNSKTLKLKLWQNSKTQIVTILKNSKCDQTQKLKLWPNSKILIFTKLKCSTFTKYIEELENIYILFIRSILEQSCVLWHSSLTVDDSNNLERVQKASLKISLQEEYKDYERSLHKVNLQSLYERRLTLCENFARNTPKHEKLHKLFPKNPNNPSAITQNPDPYQVNMAYTERYKTSSIPFMHRLLNQIEK